MEMGFVRHEPCYGRVLLVLALDRQKKKERILIGEEMHIRLRLQGNMDADVLCDVVRPLGTFLAEFEHDPDGEWNRLGLAPLREALHTNRWRQPALEQAAGGFLEKKYLTGDPVRMYATFRIWNGYLLARQPRKGRKPADASWTGWPASPQYSRREARSISTPKQAGRNASISPAGHSAPYQRKKHGSTSGIPTINGTRNALPLMPPSAP